MNLERIIPSCNLQWPNPAGAAIKPHPPAPSPRAESGSYVVSGARFFLLALLLALALPVAAQITDGTVKSFQTISDTAGGFTAILDDSDNFGNSVASIGDLDADGVTDMAVGVFF